MKKTFLLSVLASLMLVLMVGEAYAQADACLGVWYTKDNKSKVEIYKCGDKYCGKIIWLKNAFEADGVTPNKDDKNENPKLQSRPLNGLTVVFGFKYVGDNKWEEGKIYNPENGKTYSCNWKLVDKNTLDVRGYIGISMIGETQTWKRVQ